MEFDPPIEQISLMDFIPETWRTSSERHEFARHVGQELFCLGRISDELRFIIDSPDVISELCFRHNLPQCKTADELEREYNNKH